MTTPSEVSLTEQNPPARRKLLSWLSIIAEAIDYDVQKYTDANIRQLREEVKDLNTRLTKLEGGSTRAA